MKIITVILGLTLTSAAFAQIPQDMLGVCIEWQAFTVEDQGYQMFKNSLGGADPDDVDPSYGRRLRAAKGKFEAAKRKYEKKSGKKFDSNKCNQ